MKKKWLIAIDAGHGKYTFGKQSPNGEKEWNFNNKVVQGIISELDKLPIIQYVRVDDQLGVNDRSLDDRVKIANRNKADLYISVHHNANSGKWGYWSGVETFVMTPREKSRKSTQLAEQIHPKVVAAMSIKDRGIKEANFYVLRETKMPAILIEGGFMDSLVDIKKLRDDHCLSNQGRAIAQGIVDYITLVNIL